MWWLTRALDGIDVVHAAAIPLRAEPAATRCGKMVEQVGHRVVRTMRGDQVVGRKCRAPIALAARDKYDLALFVAAPIERSLDGEIGRPLALASARVCKHIGPPFFARWLLRVRPRPTFDCITSLHHGCHRPHDVGQGRIEQDEIRRHDLFFGAATVLVFQRADRAWAIVRWGRAGTRWGKDQSSSRSQSQWCLPRIISSNRRRKRWSACASDGGFLVMAVA